MKTDADLADILATDNPHIWRSHAPAKGGDTGQMFRRIIEQALEIKKENTSKVPECSEGVEGSEGAEDTLSQSGESLERRQASTLFEALLYERSASRSAAPKSR